jgi:hypothetical protein
MKLLPIPLARLLYASMFAARLMMDCLGERSSHIALQKHTFSSSPFMLLFFGQINAAAAAAPTSKIFQPRSR